ncbi:MAG: hypothetical protein HUJ26_14195 [Planctomycetaceae bacterium]|nr:hypothetical protein [Planctomycetaceae bacterium]
MKHHLRTAGLAFALACFSLLPLRADEKDPKISIVIASPDAVKADLKLMLDLKPDLRLVKRTKGRAPELEKPWDKLKEYLDEVFLLGVDSTRLIRIDLVNTDEGVKYRSVFPIGDLDDFLENLELFGIEPKRRARNYYLLSNAYDGLMRVIDDFGVIGPDRDLVPARGYDPIDDDLEKYALDKDGNALFDVVFYMLNKEGSAKKRREEYESVKEELMAAVKQKEDESKEDFELRRSIGELQLDELARYFADPAEVVIGWETDNAEKVGKLLVDMLPDKDSMLAETVAKLGTVASRFEALTPADEKILHGTINLPLDEQQQKNLIGTMELFRDSGLADVKNSETLEDGQKTAFTEIIKILSDSMIETLKAGRLDGYISANPAADGKYTLQGGLIFKNAGKNVTRAIELVPDARPGRQVMLNVDKVGDVAIHGFSVSDENAAAYADLFGADAIYIGVGPDEVWYAIGADGVETIKAAVTKANDTKIETPSKEFVSLFMKLAPWIEWRARHAKPEEETAAATTSDATDGEESTKPKVSRSELRDYALQAFKAGDDILTLSFKRDGDRVAGSGKLDTGLLRFAGHLIAKFTVTLSDEGTELESVKAGE